MSDEAFETIKDGEEGVASTSDLSVLMADHKAAIAELRAMVKDDVPKDEWDGQWLKYDDLFYLRFILSFGTPKASAVHVKECFRWRHLPETQKRISAAMKGDLMQYERARELAQYQLAGDVPGQKNGGFCVAIKGAATQQKMINALFTTEEMTEVYLGYREMAYKHNDEQTRKTGKLVKQVILFDMKGTGLSDMLDKQQAAIHSSVSKICASVYPQLQDAMVLVNAPSWMTMVMAFFKKIMPKRNMDKIRMYSSHKQMWASDWAKTTLDKAGVPYFIGGDLQESSFTEGLNGSLYVPPGEDAMEEVTVPNRDSREVRIVAPIAGEMAITMSLPGYGVNMNAFLEVGKGAGPEACEVATGEKITLAETEKVLSENGPQRKVWKIEKPGVVVLQLDNTHSMLRSKTFNYKYDFKVPEDSMEDE